MHEKTHMGCQHDDIFGYWSSPEGQVSWAISNPWTCNLNFGGLQLDSFFLYITMAKISLVVQWRTSSMHENLIWVARGGHSIVKFNTCEQKLLPLNYML